MPITAGRAAARIIGCAGLAMSFVLCGAVAAQEDEAIPLLPEIEVIGVSPMQGTGADIDEIPTKAAVLKSEDFERYNPISLPELLTNALGSAATNDVLANPYQKNLHYRGFTASPLLGEPQGLAVYQNGVRINEPFGDTVQWDLVPDVAIDQLDLVSGNPVFGLNALGGAIALNLKNGHTYRGAGAEVSGGYFGRGGVSVELGGGNDTVGIYVAFDRQHDDGWRNRSPSDIARFYTDIGVRGDRFNVNFSFANANNDLRSVGPAPIELLESNRRGVFTWPDITDNKLNFGTLNGSYDVSDTFSLQGNAYFRKVIRATLNADEVGATNCDPAAIAAAVAADAAAIAAQGNNGAQVVAGNGAGFLCTEEGAAEFVLDQFGDFVTSKGQIAGALNTSSTMTKGWGFGLQGTLDDTLLGHDNQLVLGVSADYGITRFHSETQLGAFDVDRTIDTNVFPFLFTAVFDSVNQTGVQRGSTGPVKMQAHNRYYGVYASDTFHVTEDLAVTAGGRFNIARVSLSDEFDSYFPRDIDLNGSHRFARFNPAIGFTYRMEPLRTTYYMGYSEANRAPTPAELTCADPAAPCRLPNSFLSDPPLDQVVAGSIELGLRGDAPADWLGGLTTLDWSVGLFTTESTDDILFVSAGPTVGTGFFRNVGATRRQGLEIGLSGEAGPVQWRANYSYIQATFESPFTVASPNHPFAINCQIAVKPGDNMPGVPEHNFKAGVDFEVMKGWTIGADLVATSGIYLRGDEANLAPRTSGYSIVKLRTNYRLGEWVELFGFIDNVFDTNYETFGIFGEAPSEVPIHELPGGVVTNPRYLSPGQPFGAFLGVRVRLN